MTEPASLTKDYLSFSGEGLDLTLPWYPLEIKPEIAAPGQVPDSLGELFQGNLAESHPTVMLQQTLARWNLYLASGDENHQKEFLAQARRLVEREVRIVDDVGGWPVPHSTVNTVSSHLSASVQGNCISILTRAFRLTQEKPFCEVAKRAVRSFERDILDGGVQAPIGESGVFFEDVAVYPASHMLGGFIVALFGLYDYVALTGDARVQELIDRSLATMEGLVSEFDMGWWAYTDLLSRRFATPSQLSRQVLLLEALGGYSNCEWCFAVASRWRSYTRSRRARLRYWIAAGCASCGSALLGRARTALFPRRGETPLKRVCVPLPAFPFTGGVLSVLEGVAQATVGKWELEFLSQNVGPNPNGYIIHRFGTPRMAPTQFPSVWRYVLAGWRKLIALMCKRASYHLIFPQDGVYTAAFTALAARLAGVRVVCVDHGQLTLIKSSLYRTERIRGLASRPLPVRLIGRLRLALYWPSLNLLATISARLVDHFLIPGVAGDEVEENCKRIGIAPSRLTRFASMIDIDRHIVLDAQERARAREENQIPAEATVVAIICRLSPEKGLDIALESISRAVRALSPQQSRPVRIVIAGDGPLRQQLEEIARKSGLDGMCAFWGDIPAGKVLSLLAMSDIFLYTSTRGACFPMAVLEAMASGCAVIASEQPVANAHLLAEERGIAVEPGNAEPASEALSRLLRDPELCRRMGLAARNYIAARHSVANFKRDLMRVTYWSGLDDLLLISGKQETDEKETAD